MKIKENRINKTFGPVGSFAGIIIFIVGLTATFIFSDGRIINFIVGILTTLTGAFVGFSNSSVFIDPVKKRVRFSNNIFGFIRTGMWMGVEPDMKIGVTSSNISLSICCVNFDYLMDIDHMRRMDRKKSSLSLISLPVLILHGGKDKIANVKGTYYLKENLTNSDCDLIIYPDSYHTLFWDNDSTQIFTDIVNWIIEH